MCHNNCGCNSQNPKPSCPCTETQEVTYICNQCQPEVDCDCAVKDLSTNCIIYDGDDLPCTEIKKNTILTELIQQLDAFICTLKDDIANLFVLVNIGAGKKVYAGDNLLGNKKLRTINKSGDLITVTEATEEIVIGLDEDELENTIINLIPNYNAENVGTGADVFKEEVSNTFRFRTLTSKDGSVIITETANEIDLGVEPTDPTLITPGTNVTITGTGTSLDPYIINATATGSATNFEDGVTTTLEGAGTVADPFSIEIVNLQKQITTTPYTLTNADDKFTIFVDNGTTPFTVNIPDGLVNNFSCVFVQKGTGEVTINHSGTGVLNYPSTVLENKIKGQYFWTMVEKEQTLNTYYLMGSLKTV